MEGSKTTASAIAFEQLGGEREATAARVDDMRDEGAAALEVSAIADRAWAQWLEATDFLQELGTAPRTLCDAVNGVSEAREHIAERMGHTTA